jgi:nicotinate (nicotinamide) nucleotide adenylyltransferase
MKIILFGGAFNPVTIGHISVARKVMIELGSKFDKLWFLPCYNSRWGKSLVSFDHRSNMIDIALADAGNLYGISCCNFEGNTKTIAGSYQIIQDMTEYYRYIYKEGIEFSFLIGMDHANVIQTWIDGAKFIKEFQFIVLDREGVIPNADTWYNVYPHIHLKGAEYETSSTLARHDIKTLGYTNHVCKPVMEYIKEHSLYKG